MWRSLTCRIEEAIEAIDSYRYFIVEMVVFVVICPGKEETVIVYPTVVLPGAAYG